MPCSISLNKAIVSLACRHNESKENFVATYGNNPFGERKNLAKKEDSYTQARHQHSLH